MRNKIITTSRFILLAAVFLFLGQVSVHAKTIGIVMTGDIPFYQDIHGAMLKEMSSYFTEKNIEVVTQTPLPNPMSWTNAARKLKALGVEVVVTYGLPATLATMKEAGGVPVVFAGVYSPATMNVGGKSATGISSTVSVQTVLQKLKSISNLSKIGIVFNKTEKDSIIQAREVKKLEKKLGFKTELLSISSGKLEEDKFAACDALLLTSCSAGMCKPHLPEIVKLARQNKIPTVALIGGAEHLVVMTFAPSAAEQGLKSAEILRRVLEGESPANIPLLDPEEIELILNQKVAREIGIEISAEVLDSATRVIE
jgi:putative ABC transport system substrate-binding protein